MSTTSLLSIECTRIQVRGCYQSPAHVSRCPRACIDLNHDGFMVGGCACTDFEHRVLIAPINCPATWSIGGRREGSFKKTTKNLWFAGKNEVLRIGVVQKVRKRRGRSKHDRMGAAARAGVKTKSFCKLLKHCVEKGPAIKPIRPEFLAATRSELASDDAMFLRTRARLVSGLRDISRVEKTVGFLALILVASMANAASNAFACALAYRGRRCIALCSGQRDEGRWAFLGTHL